MTDAAPPNHSDLPSPSEPPGKSDSAGISPNLGDPFPVKEPAARNIFQSSGLVFVFLRLCGYLALAYGISSVIRFFLISIFRIHLGLSPYEPRNLIIGESTMLVGLLVAAGIMAELENRPFGAYGLPARGAFGKLFWQGALLGLIEISAVVAFMAIFGAYHFGPLAIHGKSLIGWAVFWAAFFLVVGLYEEFQFRGYVQYTISQALGFWPAAVLLSLGFGLVHTGNTGENWAGIAGVILTGLLWCFTLRRTGNLWLAVGMHASFDFGETFLYSVPDSGIVFPGHLSDSTIAGPAWLTGGSVGPEASVFDFVMLIFFFFVIHRLYPAKSRVAPQTSPPS